VLQTRLKLPTQKALTLSRKVNECKPLRRGAPRGGGAGRGGGADGGGGGTRGRAVQVEPMNPMLKAPGTERFKL